MPREFVVKKGKESTQTPTPTAYFVLEEYLVTALVPSETACLASSPGRMRRTLKADKLVDDFTHDC